MIQLTSEGLLIASLNIIVAIVLIAIFVVGLRVLLKDYDSGLLAACIFTLVYAIFLIFQEYHLLLLLNTGSPLDGMVYSSVATSIQAILPMTVFFVWGYYSFNKKDIRTILAVFGVIYVVLIVSIVALLQPFAPVFDPSTQLWDMNLQPPYTYLQYSILTATLLFVVHLIFQSLKSDDCDLSRRFQSYAVGYLLYTMGIMVRFMGMDIMFTITRKILLIIGVYLMMASFTGLDMKGVLKDSE